MRKLSEKLTAAAAACLCLHLAAAAFAGDGRRAPPATGAALLTPFKQQLRQALQGGLARGPAAAVTVCRQEAPGIAASLSRDGVRMGRSSQRLRNPANAAPDWVAPILEGYLAEASARLPATVSLAGNRQGYVEPITLQPLCLGCHGDSLAPDLAERIRELYPQDRATGFAVGELRGVFWVEYPL